MKEMKKVVTDGIIFDVDGTLWDSTGTVALAWQEIIDRTKLTLGDRGLTPEEVEREMYLAHPAGGKDGDPISTDDLKMEFGKPLAQIFNDLLPNLGKELYPEVEKELYLAEDAALVSNPPTPYPGLEDALKALEEAGIPCYIVSNCQAGYIERFLQVTGYGHFFQDHLCPGDSGKFKADNIRTVAERNGLKSPCYVGDIQADLDATREAGASFIWASYGFGSCDQPDAEITELSQLISVVSKL